jgi:streptogramin lyase
MRLYPSRIEEPDLEIDAPAVATDGDTFLVVASLGGGHGGHGEGDGTYARLFAHGGGLMEEVHIGGAHLISTWPRKDLNTVAHDGDGYLIGLHSVTLDHAVLDLLRVHRGHGSHGGPKAEATSRLFQIILAGGSLFPLPSLVGYEGGFLMVSDVADGGNDVIDVIASSSEAARVIEWDLDFDPKVNRFSPFYVSHDPAASDPLFAGPWISYNGDGPAARNVVARVDPDSSFFREYRVAPATQRIGLHGIHAGNGRVWFTGNETDVFGYLDPLTRGVATVPLAPGSKPHVVVTDDLGHAWIALDGTNQLASFDPVSERLTLRTLPTPGAGPHGIFPRHDPVSGRREIWVTEREALKVARLLPGTMGQPDRWDEWTLFGVASTEPLFLVVDAADRAWVGLSRDDRIARLDPVSGLLGLFELPLVTPSPTVGALSGPVQVTLAPDGAGLALAEVGTGQLALFTPGTPGVEVRPAVVTTMAAAPFPSTPFVSRSLATFTEVLRPAIEARMVGVTRRGAFREWQTTLTNEPQPTGYSASAGGGPTRLAVVRGDLFYTEMRQDRVGFLKFSR